jgi:hypothetical protein
MIFNEALYDDIKKLGQSCVDKEDKLEKWQNEQQKVLEGLRLNTREAINKFNATQLDEILTKHFKKEHNKYSEYMTEVCTILAKDGFILMDYNENFAQFCLIKVGQVETYGIVPNIIDEWKVAVVDIINRTVEMKAFGTIGFYTCVNAVYGSPQKQLKLGKMLMDRDLGDEWKSNTFITNYKKTYNLVRYVGNKATEYRTATFADVIVSKDKDVKGQHQTSIIISVLAFNDKKLLNIDTLNLQKSVAVNLMHFLEAACPRFKGKEFFDTTYSQLEVN